MRVEGLGLGFGAACGVVVVGLVTCCPSDGARLEVRQRRRKRGREREKERNSVCE